MRGLLKKKNLFHPDHMQEDAPMNKRGLTQSPQGMPWLGNVIRPRWRKVFRDVWGNKMRTMLVVLSIAVGVFAVGMIAAARVALSDGLTESYAAINPGSAMLMVSDPFFGGGSDGFGDDLVESVRGMREVEDAEGRRQVTVRLQVGPNEWRDMQLFAIPDYDDIRVNKILPESGEWPPDKHDVLIERAALSMTQAQVGDTVRVKTPTNRMRDMRITGLTHDMVQIPAFMDGRIYGYITFDTLEWLGVSREYNELHIIVAEGKDNEEHIQEVTRLVKEKVEKSGRHVYYTLVPEPGKHPLDYLLQAIVLLLGVLGTLALLLSGFLVVTTISAILAQHVKQIGILKSIGARRWQIMQMYFVLSIAFGIIALCIALPLSLIVANGFTRFIAGMFNFDLTEFAIPIGSVVLQVVISLCVPVLAAFVPILRGTGVTIHAALLSESGGSSSYGNNVLDRLMHNIRGLSRPLLLSLRNTIRRKGRLALTLTTLTLSGSMFISVFNIRASMFQTLEDLMNLWHYDLWITMGRSYRIDELERQAFQIPGVEDAEGIGFVTTRRKRPDNSDSDVLMLFAPPPNSTMINPLMHKGRWLLPEDENGIVLSTEFLKQEPDVAVGDTITLRIDARDTTWQVVGVSQFIAPFGFVNYPHFARVKRESGRATTLWIVTDRHDVERQSHVAQVLEPHFEQAGLRISSITKIAEEKQEVELTFNIIVVLLAFMAVLLAIVGGLGLMGTMSINVLERTREIGIMRAIGASNHTVMQLVMVEGIIIGLASWSVSVLVAFLLSKPLSAGVGIALFQVPLAYAFSLVGTGIWLLVVVFLSALASFLPAWNASRLTVRAVLAYE